MADADILITVTLYMKESARCHIDRKQSAPRPPDRQARQRT
jgi:hypothetical protein